MRISRILGAGLMLCALSGFQGMIAMAQTDATPAEAKAGEDVTAAMDGSWKWDRVDVAGDVRCIIRLVTRDGETKGTYRDDSGAKARIAGVEVNDNNRVTIKLVFKGDDGESEVTLEGVRKGDRIAGTAMFRGGEQDWNATRFVALEDAVGHWRLEFSTPDGQTRNPEFKLEMVDGEPTVTFVGGAEDPSATAEITETRFKNGYLNFNAALDFQGQPLSLDYELEIKGNTLEGIMFFQFVEDENMAGEIDIDGSRIDEAGEDD